jgi:hypothetical protein
MTATNPASDERTWYRISPIDETGVFLGLSLPQLIVGCVAALVGALMMVFVSVLLGVVTVIVFGGLALARHTGEPVLHQLPTVARLARNGTRPKTWFQPLPLLGPSTNPKTLPPPLARQELLTVDPAVCGVDIEGPVAVIREAKAGLYAITLRISGRQFGLLEQHAQDHQLAQWSRVLHGFVAEHPTIASVRWSQWASPSGIEEQREWLDRNLAGQHLPDVLASYQSLLADLDLVATRHEVLLTLTTNPSKVRLQKRHRRNRHAAVMESLLTDTRLLLGRLEQAELAAHVLDPTEWARAMRLRLDPSCRAILDRRVRSLGNDAGIAPNNVLPTSFVTTRTSVTVDDAMHRSYWTKEWPRLDVPGDWLRPLLTYATHTRAITVFFEPVPRSKSQRAITAQATKIEADVTHRNEKGFRVGARHRRAAQAVKEREEELVSGHAELSFGAIVTITAPDQDSLDRACTDTTQIAAAVGIELRPLHGRHDEALLATLPCARTAIGKR